MVYGYIRVSTGKQTLENQQFEIERNLLLDVDRSTLIRYCKKNDIQTKKGA